MQTGAECEVARYPTPDELWAMTFPSTRSGTGDAADKASELAELWRDRFAEVPFEDKGGSHPNRLHPEDVTLLKELVYPATNAVHLTDSNLLLRKIPTAPCRAMMAKVLSLQSAVLARICVGPNSDIDKIASYWGAWTTSTSPTCGRCWKH